MIKNPAQAAKLPADTFLLTAEGHLWQRAADGDWHMVAQPNVTSDLTSMRHYPAQLMIPAVVIDEVVEPGGSR